MAKKIISLLLIVLILFMNTVVFATDTETEVDTLPTAEQCEQMISIAREYLPYYFNGKSSNYDVFQIRPLAIGSTVTTYKYNVVAYLCNEVRSMYSETDKFFDHYYYQTSTVYILRFDSNFNYVSMTDYTRNADFYLYSNNIEGLIYYRCNPNCDTEDRLGIKTFEGNILEPLVKAPLEETDGNTGFISGIYNVVSSISGFFSNFFTNLGDMLNGFFTGLFVPTEEFMQSHSEASRGFSTALENKFGVVSYFKQELEKAQSYTSSNDFLNINIPAWSLDLGIIEFSTEGRNLVDVKNAYEPYRIGVRGGILLIIYGLGAVYLIKYFLNYGVTGIAGSVKTGNKGGDDE